MIYTSLGSLNLRVSRYCLGTMMFGGKTDAAESARIIQAAIASGINFIDTADVYNDGASEQILGATLQGEDRDKVVLASKAAMKVGEGVNDEGVSRYHLVRAVEASLKRLKTDRIDLFYLHWPTAALNLGESLRAIDDLAKQGKILYAACSNYPAWLAMKGQWLADTNGWLPLVAGQYPYNLIERGLEIEILPMAKATGMGICVYRSLAIGVLTGKYIDATPKESRGEDDQRITNWVKKYDAGIHKLADFAKEIGRTPADVANAWVLAHPAVTSIILGISKLSQLQENLAAADFALTPEQRDQVSGFFNTEVFEEAGGNFPKWRRSLDIG